MAKNEREVQEGKLASVSMMRNWAADIFTRLVQMIKQSRFSRDEQRRWVDELAATKFEPTKFIPFKRYMTDRARPC